MVSKTLHTFKIEKSLIKACLLQSVLLFQNLDENFQYILDAQQRFWGLGLYIIAAFHCCMHATPYDCCYFYYNMVGHNSFNRAKWKALILLVFFQ